MFDKIRSVAAELYDSQEAHSIAQLLMEQLYGVSRLQLAMEPEVECQPNDELERVLRELGEGRPVQYIVGSAHFAGREFAVREGVLIPRPETEELVEWVVSECKNWASECESKSKSKSGSECESVECRRILDIGTGSGAIAILLADRLPKSTVVGIDVSTEALGVAAENAQRLGVDVLFEEADVLSPESWLGEWYRGEYDVVVSNPPYIPVADRDSMHRNVVEYEPEEALFVSNDDPLQFYRAIARISKKLLNPSGWLYFEIYELLGDEMVELLEAEGYTRIELREDINGKERMVRCQKK